MPPCHGGGRGFESRPVRKGSANAELFAFMPYYVYIIKSQLDSSYYKGYSEEPLVRLKRHNQGESNYTRNKVPWQLVYIEELPTKRDALIREKALKKYSHLQIEQLILTSKNIVSTYKSSGD